MMTVGEFVTKCRQFMNSDPVFVWGADGIEITPITMDALSNTLFSTVHNKDYYNSRLSFGRGKLGADDVGLINYISGEQKTAMQYMLQTTETKVPRLYPISSIPENIPCLVINRKTCAIGVYLGDSCVARMVNDAINGQVAYINPKEWTDWFFPHFVDYREIFSPEDPLPDSDIRSYQKWINEEYHGRLDISGVYDYATEFVSVKTLQMILNEHYGTIIKIDGILTKETWNDICDICLWRNQKGYQSITKIVNMYLHVKGYNSISMYQALNRGLEVTGNITPATLYRMFYNLG